jgi:hypothetical protein
MLQDQTRYAEAETGQACQERDQEVTELPGPSAARGRAQPAQFFREIKEMLSSVVRIYIKSENKNSSISGGDFSLRMTLWQ